MNSQQKHTYGCVIPAYNEAVSLGAVLADIKKLPFALIIVVNDGSQDITVPNINSTTARIRVMAVGNIFYNISQNNFTIL